MELGAFAANRAVSDIVRDAFASELTARAFPLAPTGTHVVVDVQRFESEFRPHFLLADADGEVSLAVTVRSASGQLLYARTANGKNLRENLAAMTAGEARQALEAALPDAVGMIVNDPEFIAALLAQPGRPTS